MIKKQTLRRGVVIKCEGELLSKEEIIALSENWNENQEMFFRKMLKQGGRFTLKKQNFHITTPDLIYNNKGEIETTLSTNDEE
jgi:hypothetical protein|tara:strand:+ start:265 stop:513 length:249 start_codon:yes stop_codon:yes gene_type:complete